MKKLLLSGLILSVGLLSCGKDEETPEVTKPRRIEKLVIKSFPATRPDGQEWDAGQPSQNNPGMGPDFLLKAGPKGETLKEWVINIDAKTSSLPYTFEPNDAWKEYKFSNKNWVFELNDNDTYQGSVAIDKMASWEVNPTTSPNPIVYNSSGYNIEVFYVEE